MKFILVLCVVLAVVVAEPPNYRNQRFQAKSAKQVEAGRGDQAPYPPSGWKPAGERLELPPRRSQKQEATTPAKEYGAPAEVYGAPAEVYGPPTTTESIETLTEVDPEVTTPPTDTDKAELKSKNEEGSFYILLPNSKLQRLIYNVQSDPQKQQYVSSVRSTGVQQLSGPLLVYEYTPQYIQLVK